MVGLGFAGRRGAGRSVLTSNLPALSIATAPLRFGAGQTSSPSTNWASLVLAVGTTRARAPWCRAWRARARTPRTGRKQPSRPSSPQLHTPPVASGLSWPLATSRARAMGRSKPGPSLRRSAGARFTITRVRGTLRPLWRRAERTRSRDSCTAASARPTMCSPGSPGARSTSTVTSWASSPCREAVLHRANIRPKGSLQH